MKKDKKVINGIFVAIYVTLASLILVLASCNGSGANRLKGTAWQLDSIAGSDLPPGTAITIEFVEDEVSGSAGCNHYRGRYQTSGNSLSVNEIFATEMACPEPAGVLEQERLYLSALGTAGSFQMAGDRLELFDEKGVQILVFVTSNS